MKLTDNPNPDKPEPNRKILSTNLRHEDTLNFLFFFVLLRVPSWIQILPKGHSVLLNVPEVHCLGTNMYAAGWADNAVAVFGQH